MSRKRKQKKQNPAEGVARPEWARFQSENHGQGAHQDRSRYTRKVKHRKEITDGNN